MRKLLVLALAPALAATSCIRPVRIDPAPSPSRAPAFTFSRDGGPLRMLDEFAVTQCRPEPLQRPLWHVARSRTQADAPLAWDERRARDSTEALRITYGKTPEGFTEVVAPEPLAAGLCYLARVRDSYGGGSREFRLLPDGRMETGRLGDWYRRGGDQLNRAAVHCRRSYRRASRADSLRIDPWRHAVADTSVTCAELRTAHPEVMKTAVSRETTVTVGLVVAAALAGFLVDELDREE